MTHNPLHQWLFLMLLLLLCFRCVGSMGNSFRRGLIIKLEALWRSHASVRMWNAWVGHCESRRMECTSEASVRAAGTVDGGYGSTVVGLGSSGSVGLFGPYLPVRVQISSVDASARAMHPWRWRCSETLRNGEMLGSARSAGVTAGCFDTDGERQRRPTAA